MRHVYEEREALQDTLSHRLREARVRAGLTQVEVAAALGVCEDVYARYERGTSLPSVETLERLCRIVGCSADWLLDDGEQEPPPVRKREDNTVHHRRVRRACRALRNARPSTVALVRSVLETIHRNRAR